MLGFVKFTHPVSRRSPWLGSRRRGQPRLEELESRTLLAIYAPNQILHAYGFDKLPYDGTGQTIAIVDAYDNPNAVSDLAAFDQMFNLPDPVFTIAQPQGQPNADINWGLEINLDVQWAHAVAPGANILLVEAKTSNFSDMIAAVDYARQQPGVVAVSMSWGLGDYPFESFDDFHFTTPAGHIGGSGLPGGITFVAASGDTGGNVLWPAASPNVLSIGGTSLTLDNGNNIASEVGWSGSGGGPSTYETKPSFQVPFQGYETRTTPDFSYNSDLYTAYWIYDSYVFGGMLGVYGTSAAAPQWAALVALADQGLAQNNVGSLDGPTQTLPALYNLANISYGTYYNDIVTGSNGYQAGPGYDLVTGIGSPIADQVVQGLVNGSAPPPSGGGATASSAHRATRTESTRGTFTSNQPIRLTPMSVTLPDRLIALAETTLPKPNDLLNQSAATPLSENGQPTFGVPSSLGKAVPAAVILGLPAPVLSSPALESRIESGGGDNGLLTDDSDGDGAADPVISPVVESASGAAVIPTTPDGNRAFVAVGDGRQAAATGRDEDPAGESSPTWETTAAVTDPLDRLPDPLAALGALAIALGGYWGKSDEKPGPLAPR